MANNKKSYILYEKLKRNCFKYNTIQSYAIKYRNTKVRALDKCKITK